MALHDNQRRKDNCPKCARYSWDATDSFCMYCDYPDVLEQRRLENVGGKNRRIRMKKPTDKDMIYLKEKHGS